MKTTFNNRELAHIWAQQSQDNGKGSNMFFEYKSIYSYGYHFEIARFIDSDTILFTTRGYSVTTSKHKSFVDRSIPDYINIFYVPSFTNHAINVKYYKDVIAEHLLKSVKAKKYPEYDLQQATGYVKTLLHYVSKFNIELDAEILELENKYNSGQLLTDEMKATIKAKESAKKQAEMQAKKQIINEWLSFERNSINVPDVLLRATSENIETTLGAKVSISEGKLLYNLIKANKPVHGFKIGYYTVNSFNGNVLKIGCHNLKITEINRFAKTQNWS